MKTRRRIHLPCRRSSTGAAVHGHHRRQRRSRCRPTSRRCSRSGTTPRPGTWRALSPHHAVRAALGVEHRFHVRCAQHMLCRLAAGRLGGHDTPDAEPRRALRPADRRLSENDVELLPFLTGDRPHDTNNFAPAPRLRLPAQRPDGGARRLRACTSRRRHRRRASVGAYDRRSARPSPTCPTTAAPTSPPNPFNGPVADLRPGARPDLLRRQRHRARLPAAATSATSIADPNAQIPYSHQASSACSGSSARHGGRGRTTSTSAAGSEDERRTTSI